MEKDLVTLSDIEHLAELSGLEFNDQEKAVMLSQVKDILDMFNACGKGYESVVEKRQVLGLEDLRDDAVIPSLGRDTAMQNTPKCRRGYVVSPKVVD